MSNDFYLREITSEDTPFILRTRNSSEVMKHFVIREPLTEADQSRWLTEMIGTGKAVQYIIMLSENNSPVGSVYIRNIDQTHKKGEFGIFIGNVEERGHGLGAMVAMEMLHIAFEKLRLHKVYLRVFPENLAAIKSYEKAGFVKEGLLKDDVFVADTFHDMLIMAAINRDLPH